MLKKSGDDMLRKQVRKYYREFKQYYDALRKSGVGSQNLPPRPVMPNRISELICGAKTRAGTPCKRKDLYCNLRCRLHGGFSTGPRTAEGKKRSALNGLVPKMKRTP